MEKQIEIAEQEETPTDEALATDASELAGPLIDGMPAPSDAEKSPAQPIPPDAAGQAFDPAIHAVDAEGRPRKNRKGKFVLLGRGRPRKEPGDAGDTEGPREAPVFADDGSSSPPDRFRVMAEMYLKSSYGPLMLLLTPDAAPDEAEHAALAASLAEWLRAEDAREVSPKWLFLLMAGGVVASKFSKPTVRERGALLWLKVRSFFSHLAERWRRK